MRLTLGGLCSNFIGYGRFFLINFANRFGIIIFKTYETKDFEAIEE